MPCQGVANHIVELCSDKFSLYSVCVHKLLCLQTHPSTTCHWCARSFVYLHTSQRQWARDLRPRPNREDKAEQWHEVLRVPNLSDQQRRSRPHKRGSAPADRQPLACLPHSSDNRKQVKPSWRECLLGRCSSKRMGYSANRLFQQSAIGNMLWQHGCPVFALQLRLE